MNMERARNTELKAFWDSGHLVDEIVYNSGLVFREDGQFDPDALGGFVRSMQDAWNIVREENWDVFTFGGTRKRVGDTEVYGRINSITGNTTLSLKQEKAVDERLVEKALITFESDWLCGLRPLYVTSVGWSMKDVLGRDPKTIDFMRLTLDFAKPAANVVRYSGR